MKKVSVSFVCNYKFVRGCKINDIESLQELCEDGDLSDYIISAVEDGDDDLGVMDEWDDNYYNAMSFEHRSESIPGPVLVEISDAEGNITDTVEVAPNNMGLQKPTPESNSWRDMLRNDENESVYFFGYYDEYRKESIHFSFEINDNDAFDVSKLKWVPADEIELDDIFDCGGDSISPFKIAYDGKIYDADDSGDNNGSWGATTFIGKVEFDDDVEEGELSIPCFTVWEEDCFEDFFDEEC